MCWWGEGGEKRNVTFALLLCDVREGLKGSVQVEMLHCLRKGVKRGLFRGLFRQAGNGINRGRGLAGACFRAFAGLFCGSPAAGFCDGVVWLSNGREKPFKRAARRG